MKEENTQEEPISFNEFTSVPSEVDRDTISKYIYFKTATADEINNMISQLEDKEQLIISNILSKQIKIIKRNKLINYMKSIGRFLLLKNID